MITANEVGEGFVEDEDSSMLAEWAEWAEWAGPSGDDPGEPFQGFHKEDGSNEGGSK